MPARSRRRSGVSTYVEVNVRGEGAAAELRQCKAALDVELHTANANQPPALQTFTAAYDESSPYPDA